MSTKPYLVVNVVDGQLGVIKERETFDEALDVAVKMAKEQCDENEDEIRKELEKDLNFVPNAGGFAVYLAQSEND